MTFIPTIQPFFDKLTCLKNWNFAELALIFNKSQNLLITLNQVKLLFSP